MTNHVRDLSAADFHALVAAADRPLLVDFWADWCGPCKAMAPTLLELALDYAGEIDIAKVDIAAQSALAELMGVQSIPLLILFRDGHELGRVTGMQTKTRLAAFIDGSYPA